MVGHILFHLLGFLVELAHKGISGHEHEVEYT